VFGVKEEMDPAWPKTGSSWLRVVPWGLRRLLNYVSQTYNNPTVYITENGVSDRTGELDDTHRVHYINSYINEVLKASQLDGCNVQGYTLWSMLDNFEWAMGYAERFGLHYIDFSDPYRPRTPKSSARAYAKIIKNNGFCKADA